MSPLLAAGLGLAAIAPTFGAAVACLLVDARKSGRPILELLGLAS